MPIFRVSIKPKPPKTHLYPYIWLKSTIHVFEIVQKPCYPLKAQMGQNIFKKLFIKYKLCPVIKKIHITFYFDFFLCITDKVYAIYVQKLHGPIGQKNELQVDFSHKFSKMSFLIERPSKNSHLYGLIKNNHSKVRILNEWKKEIALKGFDKLFTS